MGMLSSYAKQLLHDVDEHLEKPKDERLPYGERLVTDGVINAVLFHGEPIIDQIAAGLSGCAVLYAAQKGAEAGTPAPAPSQSTEITTY